MDDEKLMLLYKEGDQEAFSKLYEKYAHTLYGFLKKRLPTSEVEDAYQNVWRHLHEKRELYTSQPFAPWFFFIVKNLLVDQYRSAGRRANLMNSLYESSLEVSADEPDVEALILKLPEESRVLVKKFYLEGFSYTDIEKETGVSQMTLRKRLSRAISQMRKKPEV